MKWIFVLALTATMLPSPHLDYQLAVNGEDSPWCEVRAEGRVEVMAIVYYETADPDALAPGLPFIFDSGPLVIEDEVTGLFVEDGPVAMRIFSRPAGSTGQFRAVGGCGSVPPRDPSVPARDTDPLEECVIEFDEAMEYYAWNYYLWTDAKNPNERFRNRTETIVQVEAEDVSFQPMKPVAVQWFQRRSGLFADWFPDEGWDLAFTCGEVPQRSMQ